MKFRFRPPISLIPLISLILLLSVSFNIYQFVNRRSSSSAIPVIGVIDGDTLVLEGKVRLRLRHLDAPELNFCGGPEAKQQLENLVTGKSVDITEKILDQRGRAMALTYVGDTLINRKMLSSGWVRYHHDQTTVTADLKAVAAAAKSAKLGIFGPKCWQTENPDRPDCLIKGNLNNATGEKSAQKAGYVKSLACPSL